MATHRISILGAGTSPDTTGECYMAPLDAEITYTSFAGSNLVMVMKDPSADTGFYGQFQVPQNYAGTAKVGVIGVLDGTVGATTLAFEFSYIPIADNEATDVSWTSSATWTQITNSYANEDVVNLQGTLGDLFATGDIVPFYMKRDFSVDGFVGDFHILDLYFEYSDT